MTKSNKKGHAGLIIFILILVLVIGGGTGFYFYQRQQPRKAVENFLDSMKKMDFNTMESMIQSSDLTALDNADIRDAAYTDFFSEINKKMTYKITRTDSTSRMVQLLSQHISLTLTEPIFIKRLSLNFSVRSFPTLMPETSLQKKRHRQNLLPF